MQFINDYISFFQELRASAFKAVRCPDCGDGAYITKLEQEWQHHFQDFDFPPPVYLSWMCERCGEISIGVDTQNHGRLTALLAKGEQ